MCQRDRLRAVSGLPYHLDVVLDIEHRSEPGPHQGLIIGEQNPDQDAPAAQLLARGSQACTRNPPPGFALASSRPPSAATRSRMPGMP